MKNEESILELLIQLCDDLAWARPADENALYALTARGAAPERFMRLAEAFGLMLVKVAGRDLYNQRLIEKLTLQNMELEKVQTFLQKKNSQLMGIACDTYSSKNIIGQSPQILQAVKLADTIAKRPINTLLLGETGTGKEIFAKYIHFNSPRKEAPFIAVNCTAIPEPLFESEMFGIEKGVATGVNQRKGFFEEANGGTLFLDEVADMSLANQAKLLRVLNEQEVVRLGSSKPVSVDVKIIAATNVDLEKAMREGKFRQDLYYRLAVVEIKIPPLRERGDDILLIAQKLLDKHCYVAGRKPLTLSPKAKQALLAYSWQGNVRELNNEMEKLSVLCVSNTVELFDLSSRIQNTAKETSMPARQNAVFTPLSSANKEECFNLQKNEENIILETLKYCNGNKSKAANLLGITREGLRKKLLKMHLE